MRRLIPLLTMFLAVGLGPAPAASAEIGFEAGGASVPPTTEVVDPFSGPSVTTLEDVTYDSSGRQISRTIRTVGGGISTQKTESGSEGSSSASGCRTATLRNRKYSLTGTDHMYTYTTVTSWCWNRSQRKITSPSTSWDIYIDNGSVAWRGEIARDIRSYTSISGYPQSGYYHYRQGHLENCFPVLGCTGSSYPRNQIWSHSDGTWRWQTDD